MKTLRNVRMMVVAAAGLLVGGCHYHGHWHGGHVHGCGDGGLILLGALGIAWGISAIAEACRCR